LEETTLEEILAAKHFQTTCWQNFIFFLQRLACPKILNIDQLAFVCRIHTLF